MFHHTKKEAFMSYADVKSRVFSVRYAGDNKIAAKHWTGGFFRRLFLGYMFGRPAPACYRWV